MTRLAELVARPERGVTVVVPAYNVERYLGPCLDSVVAQTWWHQCRVLVIDDGSEDATGAVAQRYADAHATIDVVHQRNAGPGAGAARNSGLDRTRTEYVMFLDGDDELTPHAVEVLLSGLQQHRLDLAIGATEQFPQPRHWLWSAYFDGVGRRPVRVEEVPLLVHDARTCNKLYATRWLRRSGLRFAEGIHHQDTVVNVPAMLLVPRLVLVNDVVHRYRKRAEGGSVMDSHYTRLANYWDHLQVIEVLMTMMPRVRRSRRPLLQAFIARSFQGFARRAPAALPSDRLSEYFMRASAVIRRVDPAVIEQATAGADQRAAYVTMLERDFDSFRRLDASVVQLRAHRGDLYLDVPASSESTRGLLRTGATRAWADGLGVSEEGIRFRLRLRIAGAVHLDTALLGIRLRVMSGTRTIAEVPVSVHPDEADPREHQGEVTLPLAELDPGTYRMRLGFLTDTGRTDRWIRRPADGKPEQVSGQGVRVRLATSDDRAELTVGPVAPEPASHDG